MKLFPPKNAMWLFVTIMVATVAFAFGQEVQLPEGDGKKIVESKCASCHDLTYVTKQRLTKEGWEEIVKLMVASGAFVADDEHPVLLDYLAKNFGADAAPAENKPLPDGPAVKILDEKCQGCHDLTLVTNQRLTKEGWTDIIKVMVASGASVTDDEVVVLAEYLGANFGPEK
jgi:cytochrome c5